MIDWSPDWSPETVAVIDTRYLRPGSARKLTWKSGGQTDCRLSFRVYMTFGRTVPQRHGTAILHLAVNFANSGDDEAPFAVRR